MGIIGWLLVWLIVNTLFVVWRVPVVSSQLKTDGSICPRSRQDVVSPSPVNSLAKQR